MSFRRCPHNNEPCECNDIEMQPCLAALIEAYLEIVGSRVPGDGYSSFYNHNIDDIFRTFPTWDALKVWIEGPE
jgi:hypothetical protein